MTTLDSLRGPPKWSEVVQNDHKAYPRLITIKIYIVRFYFVSFFHITHNSILMASHVTTRVVGSGHIWPQSKVSTYYYEVAYCSISFWEFVYFVSLLTDYDHPCDHKSGRKWSKMTTNQSFNLLLLSYILFDLILKAYSFCMTIGHCHHPRDHGDGHKW